MLSDRLTNFVCETQVVNLKIKLALKILSQLKGLNVAALPCERIDVFLTHVENGPVSASHTQPFHGPLSRTTWVGWYQKKHSPTPTHLYFIVKHPLSTSIYYYPQHPPCSIYVLGSPFPQPLSSFSLVFLGMGPSASYFMQFLRHHVQIMNFCWAFEITYNNTHFSLWYPSIYCLLKVVASGYRHYRLDLQLQPFICQRLLP